MEYKNNLDFDILYIQRILMFERLIDSKTQVKAVCRGFQKFFAPR